ncbi:MAG TPA: hypothetical protein VLI04_22655 [Nocardioidaceae bacterium]|nr:hypothetical protein [Nocardioidaceae bacterium]
MKTLELLPLDRAFTWREAHALGVTRRELKAHIEEALVRVLFRGVFIRYDVQLTVERRTQALSLVLPNNAVATDETAAWLHGVDLFRGMGEEGLPRLHFFQAESNRRLRTDGVESGSRELAITDVMRMGRIRVTTPLRTALDLARLRRGPRALAALDGLLRLGVFRVGDLERELERFKGYRGIVQARLLVPLADERSDSVAESCLRFEWLSASNLPRPTPQLPVHNPFSQYPWFLDLGVEELKYAAEYDGIDFHSTPEQRDRDTQKRDYLTEEEGWTFDVFTKDKLFRPHSHPAGIIQAGILEARRKLGLPAKEHRWPFATDASRPWGVRI